MILTKDQVQGFLDPEFFHFRCLGDDHLFLFLRDIGLLEQQPSLAFVRDLNSMCLNFSKLLVMLSDVWQQCLTWFPGEVRKVCIKILWKSNPAVIPEGIVKQFHQIIKSSFFVDLVQIKTLYKFPCCALQRSNDVQDALGSAFLQLHFEMVDSYSFSPFLIRTRLTIKNWGVWVLQTSPIMGCRLRGLSLGRSSFRCGLWWHLWCQWSSDLQSQWSSRKARAGSWGVNEDGVNVKGDVVNGVEVAQRIGARTQWPWLRYQCWLVGSQPKFKALEVLVQQIAKGKQGLFLEDVASWVATRCPPILEWKKGNGNEIC